MLYFNVVLYSIATGKIIKTIKAHRGWVLSVAFSPEGKFIFRSGDDKIVKIWTLSP
jgi:WD40 repeat protein